MRKRTTDTVCPHLQVSGIRKIVANIFRKPLDKTYIIWYNIYSEREVKFMWLQDIERAIKYMRGTNNTFKDYVFTKIIPAQNGVAFFTSHFTVVYVHNDGKIEEINND